MEIFSSNDEAYRHWLAANPQGFVLNSYRNPSSEYLMLHKADCENGILAHQHRNPTAEYTKWCSLDRQELIDELSQQTGGEVTEAGCCFR